MPQNYVWLSADSHLDRVIMLFDNTIIVANPSREAVEQIQAELDSGAILTPERLGTDIVAIPVSSIVMVTANRHRADINIRYKKDTVKHQNISCGDSSQRNEFFGVLQERLEPDGFEYTEKQFSAFQASLFPTFVMLAAIFFTYICYGAALEASAGVEPVIRGRFQLFKIIFAGIVTLIGPTGAIILGVILIGILGFWMVSRVKKPPIMMTLAAPKRNTPTH